MYLKTLNIKGFKSFADRVSLNLEPGITAIVGPNGSGKSNISDAILWVLGERNARHLRGQAMDDVIFAGSAARRASGLAEVELVLDNADATLPLDYDEVSIARRIYRSGESEYLVNGSIVRRRDVVELLHDCGLGGSAHSIISQGSLEEILQSSPAERQAMVEEAAGILKHKQRRERAAKKLEAIEQHLIRVRDIAALLKAQLKPLARKAARVRSYEELKGRYDATRLAIAVDDLRQYQRDYETVETRERQLRELLAGQREALKNADDEIERLQHQMRERDDGRAERSKAVRRLVSAGKSLGGVLMVVRERRRQDERQATDLATRITAADGERDRRRETLRRAREDLRRIDGEYEAASGSLATARKARDEAQAKLADAEERLRTQRTTLRERESALRRIEEKLATLNETLGEATLRLTFIEGTGDDLRRSLDEAVVEAESLARQVEEGTRQLAALIDQEEALSASIRKCIESRTEARDGLEAARRTLAEVRSQKQVVEERARAWLKDSGAARSWLEAERATLPGHVQPIGDGLSVEEGYEDLVERVLGADEAAVIVDDPAAVAVLADRLGEAGCEGAVSLILRAGGSADRAKDESLDYLADHVTVVSDDQLAADALIGDVVIRDSLGEALAAIDGSGRRSVTRDGALVWSTGKVALGADSARGGEGPLSLKRDQKRLDRKLAEAERALEAAHVAAEEAEETLAAKESERLALGERLAEMRGRVSAAQARADEAQTGLGKLRAQIDALQSQKSSSEAVVEKTRPEIERAETERSTLAEQTEELRSAIGSTSATLEPLRTEAADLAERLSEKAVENATLEERKSHLKTAAKRAEEAIAQLDRDRESETEILRKTQRQITALTALAERFAALQQSALERSDRLEAQDADGRQAINHLHDEWENATRASRGLHDAFDETNERLSDIRVEKSQLESAVRTTVEAIVEDLGQPLEEALGTEPLRNRAEAIAERDRLAERLRRIGSINPDAVSEYDELNERFQYVQGQLYDLEAAHGALATITEAIDQRMALDFERTFELVREKFLEIFTQLFPGGTASLALIEPDEGDDVSGGGIEVSAQPRGKRITKMTLMSGGEKSLTAIALLFAIYQVRSAPFYLLDEVEAALDDTNLRRLLAYLETVAPTCQLIVITHQRSTMEMADVLFGVTMQSDGVTQVVSQRLGKRGDLSDGAL